MVAVLYHQFMTNPRARLHRIAAAALLAFLSVSMAVPGCATVKPVADKVPGVVDCTTDQVRKQLPSIIAEVTTHLPSGDYVALLTKLGQRVGTDVLVCSVQASADSAAVRMASTVGAQPNATAIQDNAAAYLALRDVHFAAPPPPPPSLGATAYCPGCNLACNRCIQLTSPNGQLLPPSCVPRSPRPAGCP